ncbi:MAG: V-type ATP synthase subunit I [Thermaceae bacterium]|nr:V-type ATP synthase subunit I [Thermaceae bacterium]
MTATVEKLIVVGPKRLARELLAELQRAGVVHLDPLRPEELGEYRLSPAEEAELRRWDALASQAEGALSVMGVPASPGSKSFAGSLEEAEASIQPLAGRTEILGKERSALEEEIQAAHLFGKPAEKLAGLAQGLDTSPRLAVIPFLVSKAEELEAVREALQKALPDRFALDSDALDNQLAVVVVVKRSDLELARSTLSRLGLAELRYPGPFASLSLAQAAARMKERAKLAPEELVGIRGELERLAATSTESLQGLWARAKDESARLKAASDLAAGKYGMALMGWVPQKAKAKVEEALSRLKDQIVYTFELVDEHHEADQAPVTLENPAWAKPFELLHGFLNTPRYGGYDPTLMIAIFFPIFFGMVVGDIGIGILFGLVAWWLGNLSKAGKSLDISFLGATLDPKTNGLISRVLWWMTFWAIVWGFIFGEFFGTFAERLHIFYDPHHAGEGKGLIPILINRLDFERTSTLLIVLCLIFGIFQVLYAFLIKAYYAWKHHSRLHLWEGIGYFAGLFGLVAFAYSFQTGKDAALTTPILIVGLIIFVLGVGLARNPLMIAELPGKGGQILSYIRIYAVGVAGAVLFDLANQVGFGLSERLGFLGILIGLILGVLLVLFIIAVTLLGHVLQPIRLLWIEFATNFGFFEESGRPYRPFKSIQEK